MLADVSADKTSDADAFIDSTLVVSVPLDMVNVPNFGCGVIDILLVIKSMSVIDITGLGDAENESV